MQESFRKPKRVTRASPLLSPHSLHQQRKKAYNKTARFQHSVCVWRRVGVCVCVCLCLLWEDVCEGSKLGSKQSRKTSRMTLVLEGETTAAQRFSSCECQPCPVCYTARVLSDYYFVYIGGPGTFSLAARRSTLKMNYCVKNTSSSVNWYNFPKPIAGVSQ